MAKLPHRGAAAHGGSSSRAGAATLPTTPIAPGSRFSALPKRIDFSSLGEQLGAAGNEKAVFRLRGANAAGVVVGVMHAPSETLNEMLAATAELKGLGFPVVECSEPITVRKPDGRMTHGVYMEEVPGAVTSDGILSRMRDAEAPRDYMRHLNQRTLDDLDRIEHLLRKGVEGRPIAVWDLQLLVAEGGAVSIADPARVVPVAPTDQRQQTFRSNLKLIEDVRNMTARAMSLD